MKEELIATLGHPQYYLVFTNMRLIILDHLDGCEWEDCIYGPKGACATSNQEPSEDPHVPEVDTILQGHASYREIPYYRIHAFQQTADHRLVIRYTGLAWGSMRVQEFCWDQPPVALLEELTTRMRSILRKGRRLSRYLQLEEQRFNNALQNWALLITTLGVLLSIPDLRGRMPGLQCVLAGLLVFWLNAPAAYLFLGLPFLCDGLLVLSHRVTSGHYAILFVAAVVVFYLPLIWPLVLWKIVEIFWKPWLRRLLLLTWLVSFVVVFSLLQPRFSDNPVGVVGFVEILIAAFFLSRYRCYADFQNFKQAQQCFLDRGVVPSWLGNLALGAALGGWAYLGLLLGTIVLPNYNLRNFNYEMWQRIRLNPDLPKFYYEYIYAAAVMGFSWGLATLVGGQRKSKRALIATLLGSSLILACLGWSVFWGA